MRRRGSSATALILTMLALGAEARGQTPADGPGLVRRGVGLRAEGRDREALALFVEAYAADPSPNTLCQMALAEQSLGHWVEAESHLTDALAAPTPWIRSNEPTLRNALAVIGEHLTSLALEVSPAGAAVRVDGQLRGTAPLAAPLRVEAGTVVVEVRADGHHALTRTLQLRAGVRASERIALTPTPAPQPVEPPGPPGPPGPPPVAPERPPPGHPSPPPAAPLTPPQSATSWAPVVFAISGASVMLGGLALHLAGNDRLSTLRDRCAADDLPSTEAIECNPAAGGAALQRDASALLGAATGAYILGVASLGTALVWSLAARNAPRAVGPSAVQCSPLEPRGCSVSLHF